jgi:hypothetical protein
MHRVSSSRRWRGNHPDGQRPGAERRVAPEHPVLPGRGAPAPQDRRFAGKAIPLRNAIVVGGLSLALPALHLRRRPRPRYPFWLDDLYLSIFWVDMAGNSFAPYDRYFHFDLLPHFHGTGAASVVLGEAFRLPPLSAVGLANIVHLLLEGQEYYTNVLFGTHNVRGAWDVVNDLLAGLLGTATYGAAYALFDARRDARRRSG